MWQLANSYHELLEYVPAIVDPPDRVGMLICRGLQRVLVERPSDSWELFAGSSNWQRIVRKGLPCYAQAYEWLEGMRRAEVE